MKKILVIEDTSALRADIVSILGFEGFLVEEAEDGEVGIKKARETMPDLIVCDIGLPKKNGFEVLRALLKDPVTASIPFIFLTASADMDTLRKGMDLGADDYLTKPFNSDKLLSAINMRFEKQAMLARASEKKLEELRENLIHFISHGTPKTVVVETPIPEGKKADTGKLSDSFHSRYEVHGVLGRGGMGAVYDCFDKSLKRKCAIKVLKKKLHQADILKRFQSEARLTASINHPNIIQIYAVSEEDEHAFFVMEKFSTKTLQDLINIRKFIPLKKQINIFTQIIKGLKAAKKMNLLHRDIKPANILIDEENYIKIIDFGICKVEECSAGNELTDTGIIMGTPQYISPEQGKGMKDIDYKTDIYSAAATFYHFITGEPPFVADSAVELIMQHCDAERPDLRDKLPHCPATLAELLLAMMHTDREKRPDYDEILKELERTYDALVLSRI
ncbi:protein kinase [Candidatus Riflebacteria bacterium]